MVADTRTGRNTGIAKLNRVAQSRSRRSGMHDMKALNLQNRTVALMENGSWAPSCARQMRALLEEMKSMEILEPVVTLKSALKDDSLAQLDALRDALIASLMTE